MNRSERGPSWINRVKKPLAAASLLLALYGISEFKTSRDHLSHTADSIVSDQATDHMNRGTVAVVGSSVLGFIRLLLPSASRTRPQVVISGESSSSVTVSATTPNTHPLQVPRAA